MREAAGVIVGVVQGFAGGVVSFFTVDAGVAWYVVRDEDAVANFQACYLLADLVNYACGFVTQHTWCLRNTVPLQNVTSANTTCHNFEQNFFLADFRERQLFNANVFVIVINSYVHRVHQKSVGLSFSSYNLIVKVLSLFWREAFMDYCANRFD